MLLATDPPGPGLDPDAVHYLGAASALVQHGSYRVPIGTWSGADSTQPLAHFPPGFPTAIAVPIAAGLPAIQAARLIVALSAFASAALLFLLVHSACGARVAAAAVALAASTPALVDVHLAILSEPLFMALALATIILVLDDRPWAAGVAAAAAAMVRYAGAAIVAGAVLGLLCRPGAWRRRVRAAVAAALPAAIVIAAWTMRAARTAGTDAIRRVGVYRGLLASLRSGLSTIADWLAPATSGLAIRTPAIGVALLVLGTIGWRARRAWRGAPADGRAHRTLVVIGLVAGCYTVLIVVARALADPMIPFDGRILAPLLLLVEIAAVIAAAVWWRRAPRDRLRLVVASAVVCWGLASVSESVSDVRAALIDGIDFASADWRESPTVGWVRAHGAGTPIYTNWPAALYFQAARATHEVPPTLDALTLRRFGDRLARQRGVLVGFIVPSPGMAAPDSIAARLRLRRLAAYDDGSVWGPP